ncbi:hypothetical protein Droror1_Dr00002429 [Drosera rotundifolia]
MSSRDYIQRKFEVKQELISSYLDSTKNPQQNQYTRDPRTRSIQPHSSQRHPRAAAAQKLANHSATANHHLPKSNPQALRNSTPRDLRIPLRTLCTSWILAP